MGLTKLFGSGVRSDGIRKGEDLDYIEKGSRSLNLTVSNPIVN